MMGLHSNAIFKNSCLKVPLNPTNRLPSANYERKTDSSSSFNKKESYFSKKMSFDSNSSDNNNIIQDTTNPLSFRDFFKSIPDYEEVTHMSNKEFYTTLENLKENKNKLLKKCGKSCAKKQFNEETSGIKDKELIDKIDKYISLGSNISNSRKANDFRSDTNNYINKTETVERLDLPVRKSCTFSDIDSPLSTENNVRNKFYNKFDKKTKLENDSESRRINNFSIGVNNDNKKRSPTPRYLEDVDRKYGSGSFGDNKERELILDDNYLKKSYSLPTSPLKKRRFGDVVLKSSSPNSYNNITKKDSSFITHARSQTADLENKILKSAQEHKQFRANPVPIESRIPLFDKIMEDQELRRSITKLQSTAELQAQMKPFTFTEREERQNNLSKCYRLCRSNPHLSATPPCAVVETNENAKNFKAKPVPKNLFSNYVYEKMREDDFYRKQRNQTKSKSSQRSSLLSREERSKKNLSISISALNRRIRAEEMLKAASLPPSMAKRERLKSDSLSPSIMLLQDVAIDGLSVPNESFSSGSSGGSGKPKGKKGKRSRRCRGSSGKRKDKLEREYEQLKKEFIDGYSPRKAHSCNNVDITKKIYGSSSTPSSGNPLRVHSASEIPSVNRSNLAAILRMEATKRKLEAEMVKILEEERFQSEVKWRDSVLRRKPAWNSIKYNHSSELAMRLQTRKEEERFRREQFLHDMERMYGRVHQQPLMFERAYPPKRYDHHKESVKERLLGNFPRSAMHHRDSRISSSSLSPNRSRKVSINEMAETIGDDLDDILYHSSDDDDKASKSSDIPESISNGM